jgi:hypothetical protein
MSLELQPITFSEAAEYIRREHRHHTPPLSWKFGVAVNDGEKVVGVIVIGRPVARHYDNGWTLEVTRCCTDGTKNACSMLYSAAKRATFALGYRKLITYTRSDESGSSLKAAGWRVIGERKARSWQKASKSRPRVDKSEPYQRVLWEAS